LSFFFFSSRRRHTRFSRDWSSDVCSSDLLSFMRKDFRAVQLVIFHCPALFYCSTNTLLLPAQFQRLTFYAPLLPIQSNFVLKSTIVYHVYKRLAIRLWNVWNR